MDQLQVRLSGAENADLVPDATASALEAAERAIALDPDLSAARTAHGYVLFSLGRWDAAETEFRRGAELNPGNPVSHQRLGEFLAYTGRAEEGIPHLRRAIQLDPLSKIALQDLTIGYTVRQDTALAIRNQQRALELDPEWPRGWFVMSIYRARAGHYTRAREAAARYAALTAHDSSVTGEWIEALIGFRRTGAPATLSPDLIAFVEGGGYAGGIYAELGQTERALQSLEKDVRGGDRRMVAFAANDPAWDHLRDHPRYRALLEEAGVTW